MSQLIKLTDLISTGTAAALMGVSKRRVRALIEEPCPVCQGDKKISIKYRTSLGEEDDGLEPCPRCFETGRRLPAVKIQRDYAIPRQALDLVQIAGPGRPSNNKE